MDIVSILQKYGIPTYSMSLYTALPANATQRFPIGGNLPEVIGAIYGLSIYTDGVTPENNDLLTTTDAFNMYLSFKVSTDDFQEEIRLSDMVSFVAGTPVTTRPDPYLRVMIPNSIDLTKSMYLNPTLIPAGANNKTVALRVWYISVSSYRFLIEKGIVEDSGKLMKKGK